ncbi:sp110 nuclear body protein [Talpa occidentalis]|uniref:sp110 nuclear body protein n=1 Tax=Talpa occidentalis TaxID=50954 RepID=UPI0023F9AC13|nr:sp110 nuclear body protein [Talpa occidentalis]
MEISYLEQVPLEPEASRNASVTKDWLNLELHGFIFPSPVARSSGLGAQVPPGCCPSKANAFLGTSQHQKSELKLPALKLQLLSLSFPLKLGSTGRGEALASCSCTATPCLAEGDIPADHGTWKGAGAAPRIFTMTRVLEEALHQHFRCKKLEIAYAIHKPFPFVESLLDNAFITENFYRESLEAYRNLVPVSQVIYNILAKLEKTFNLSLLKTLFRPLHLYEYPKLKRTFKSFHDVVNSHGGWSRLAAVLDLDDTAEWSSHQPRLLPLPTPQQPSSSLPPQPPAVTKPEGSKPEGSTPHSTEILGEQPSPAAATPRLIGEGRLTPDNLASQVNDGDSPEKPGARPDSVQVSSDKPAPQGKDEEDAPEMPSAPSGPVPMIREDSPEPNDSKEPQEVPPETPKKGKKRKRSTSSSSRKRDHKKSLPRGAASPDPEIQEQPQVGDQETPWKDDFAGKPWRVTTAQKATSQPAPTSGPEDLTDHESKVPLGQSPGKKQKRRKQDIWSSPKRRPKNRLPGGAALPDHGIQEQLRVGDQATPRKEDSAGKPQVVTKAQKARSECAPEDPEDHGSQVSLGQSPAEKKKRRKQDSWSSPKRRPKNRPPGGAASPGRGTQGKRPVRNQATPRKDHSAGQPGVVTTAQKRNLHPPETGPEVPGKSEDESEDFNSPILPVICGDVKGFLYKEKMKRGSLEKCIQNETGVWFTPHEFEIEGKRANSKKWKRSVRCRGQTLEQLLEKGLLHCPPRISLKRGK